jgi:hypothetical protein
MSDMSTEIAMDRDALIEALRALSSELIRAAKTGRVVEGIIPVWGQAGELLRIKLSYIVDVTKHEVPA